MLVRYRVAKLTYRQQPAGKADYVTKIIKKASERPGLLGSGGGESFGGDKLIKFPFNVRQPLYSSPTSPVTCCPITLNIQFTTQRPDCLPPYCLFGQ